MARLSGELVDTFTTTAPPQVARDHFVDLDAAIAATTQAKVADKLDDHTVKFTLHPQQHGAYTVEPVYTIRYTAVGDDTAVWETLEGNMGSDGRAVFKPAPGGGTRIEYRHTIGVDLPLPKLVVKMLQPVVAGMVTSNVRVYVKDMIASLEAKSA